MFPALLRYLATQMLGFNAAVHSFKIQNMVATGDCGFPIRLEGIAHEHSKFSSYEPELFPGLIYRVETPRIVLLIFVSGKIVVTGASICGATCARKEQRMMLISPSPPVSSPASLLCVHSPSFAGAKGRSAIVEGVNQVYPMLFKFRKAPSATGGGAGAGAGSGY
jgi:hypothetical protein